MAANKPIVVNGKQFASIAKAALAFGVKAGTLAYRLQQGYKPSVAVETCLIGNRPCRGRVYLIYNTENNKKYIGVTTLNVRKRFAQHKNRAARGSRTPLHSAMRELGHACFGVKLLARASTTQDLLMLEKKYISQYDCIKEGYNVRYGGAIGQRKSGYVYEGKSFQNIKELADAYGLTESAARDRLRVGTSLSIPIGMVKYDMKKNPPQSRALVYKNRTFVSVSALARFLKINRRTLGYRMSVGSIEARYIT